MKSEIKISNARAAQGPVRPLTYASLCSGIEAATVAWHPLGWRAAFFSEIETFPSAVLAHHWPEIPNLGDMTDFENWPDRCDCPEDADATSRCNFRKTITLGTHTIKIYVCSTCGGISIDLLVGGTPCQSFSIAGLRKGLDDPRGNLMLTFGEIAARYRPRWLVWENVPGVLSSAGGRDFASFLGLLSGQTITPPAEGWANSGMLSGIPSAYGLAWRTLDAQYFGVAQRRRRVFVIGHLGGHWQRPAAVLFERASLCGNPPPRRQKRQRIAPSLDVRAGRSGETTFHTSGGLIEEVAPTIPSRNKSGGGLGTDFDCDGGRISTEDGFRNTEIARPLLGKPNSSHEESQDTYVTEALAIQEDNQNGICIRDTAGSLRSDAPGTQPCGTLALVHESTPIGIEGGDLGFALRAGASTLRAASSTEAGHNARAGDKDENLIVHSLRAEGHDASEDGTGRGTPLVPEIADCLQERDSKGSDSKGSDSNTKNGHILPMSSGIKMAVRRLTPRECERLQGFPDDYTLIKFRNKPACDGPRYKSLGNSMARPVMHWLGQRIEHVETLCPWTEA